MSDQFRNIQRRTLQYWMVDGITEIGFGLLCLLLGAYFYLQATLQNETLFTILNIFFVALIIGFAFLMNRLVVAAKSRLTFPRTGYVSYKRGTGWTRWARILITFGIAGTISILFSLLFNDNPYSLDWLPAAMGVIFSFAMLVTAWRTGVSRFYLLAVGALVLGVLLSFMGLGDDLGVAYFYFAMSVLYLLSGFCTLFRYLRTMPEPGGNDA